MSFFNAHGSNVLFIMCITDDHKDTSSNISMKYIPSNMALC